MKREIKMVEIRVLKTSGISGFKMYEVGQNGVTEIKDNTIETEQNTVLQYLIYVDGKMKYSYENGVYEIEYKV